MLRAQGIDVQSVGTNVKDNVVDIAVRALTGRAEAYVIGRYGTSVRVAEDAIEPATGAPE